MQIEEQILECIAWRSDSPVWEQLGSKQVPQAQQVLLPSQLQVNCQEAANAPQRTGMEKTNIAFQYFQLAHIKSYSCFPRSHRIQHLFRKRL